MLKLSIRAAETSQRLMGVIKNPITQHLPLGCKKYSTSLKSSNLINIRDFVPKNDENIVIVIGGISHGKVIIFFINFRNKIMSLF